MTAHIRRFLERHQTLCPEYAAALPLDDCLQEVYGQRFFWRGTVMAHIRGGIELPIHSQILK